MRMQLPPGLFRLVCAMTVRIKLSLGSTNGQAAAARSCMPLATTITPHCDSVASCLAVGADSTRLASGCVFDVPTLTLPTVTRAGRGILFKFSESAAARPASATRRLSKT